MFLATYDLVKYGKMVRSLREREKYSQQDIRDITGVHTDTLRRIEKGDTIPKYSTLEILSVMYKVNLIELLNNYKIRHTIYDLYLRLDQIILLNNSDSEEEINTLISELNFIRNSSYSMTLVNENQLRQTTSFVQCVKNYRLKLHNYESNIKNLTDCIRISINEYDTNQFQQFKYNHLELRILLMIALCEVEIKHYSKSTEILIFIRDNLISRDYLSSEDTKILLKTITNLAYNCYKIKRHEETIHHCNLGISIAQKHQIVYSMHLMYARRAIAKIKLCDNTSSQDFTISLALLEAQGHNNLKDIYIDVFEKKYNYKNLL